MSSIDFSPMGAGAGIYDEGQGIIAPAFGLSCAR